ncbi:MAG: hypothetical protein EXR99_16250, partial [Gemmataceae bacterium]|nr:hypothetical protein [Gemmataceae bacterium]
MTRKVIINKLHLETLEDRTTPSTFAEPVALSSVNSILDITFRAHQSTQMIEVKQAGNIFAAGIPTPVDGFLTYAWTINQGMASNLETTGDTYPSPTLKVNPSDTLVIRIINELENLSLPGSSTMSFPTNLHTHGLEISPLGNSDNIILSVAPGMQNVFEFHVPSTHEEGTFWYHPHRHEFTHEQVYRGLAGLLIIGRANSGIDQVADFPTRLMVLQNQDIRENPSSGRFEL